MYYDSLRTKLIADHSLDISQDKQTDISQLVDSSLDRYNVEPSAPGLQLDIGYLEKVLQKQINAVCGIYNEAFATVKYDIGLFKGFSCVIDTKEGSKSLERERKLKPHILEKITPIITKLVQEGVFEKQTCNTDFAAI